MTEKVQGLFIPGITTEMFRNARLEAIEELITFGIYYDIERDAECLRREEAEK